MNVRTIFFAGLLATFSALAIGAAMTPTTADAATCMLVGGKWKCGGATLKAAKGACNATTGEFKHECDSGINVCTCATKSTLDRGAVLLDIDNDSSSGTQSLPPRK